MEFAFLDLIEAVSPYTLNNIILIGVDDLDVFFVARKQFSVFWDIWDSDEVNSSLGNQQDIIDC